MQPFLCAEEVLLLAKDRAEKAAQLESLQARLREAEDSVSQLKGALFSKEAAITEMKERLESPLRKVVETLSSKLLILRLPFSSTRILVASCNTCNLSCFQQPPQGRL